MTFPNVNLSLLNGLTPKQAGYFFPAEFAPQDALWLSWPHKEESWPGKLASIYKPYCEFIKAIAAHQQVNINVVDEKMKIFAMAQLNKNEVPLNNIYFYFHPTNDAWCRDHGPAFLINPDEGKKLILDWGYNAWGGKYPPFNLDDDIPTLIGAEKKLPVMYPGIIMEGGSVDFNGKGTIITSKSCLLNPNRNPHLSQSEIENYLMEFYGASQILWVDDGIVGDDTDGHIDDTVRFVNEDTVVTIVEENKRDENYELLQVNLQQLKAMRLLNGKQLNIIELPMPEAVIYDDQRLPASYANFYIGNKTVVMPTYRSQNDAIALDILQQCFADRTVIGIDSTDIVWGLGSFHCLSQQEPSLHTISRF